MTVIRPQRTQMCVQSVFSLFLNPTTAERVSQQVVSDLIAGVSRDQLLSRLQSTLDASGIQISREQMSLWLDRIVCLEKVPTIQTPQLNPHKLHPIVAGKANQLLKLSQKAGYKIQVIAGWRSFAEQDALYASGQHVTNARGGESFHNYGLAFDVVFVDEQGKASFDKNHHWKAVGEMGKSLGLKWGGDFRSIKDLGHFEWHPGKSLLEIQKIYQQEGMKGILEIVND